MLNKRLLNMMDKERKYVIYIVILKLFSLCLNIFMIYSVANFIEKMFLNKNILFFTIGSLIVVILLQALIINLISKYSNNISINIKEKIRTILFDKIYSYGMKYSTKFNVAEVVQLSVNGVENLEVYFNSFIPQLIYSMLSPIILFIFIGRINLKIAVALFLMIPLIPIAIIMVQKIAKKINAKQWKSYVDLSEVFVDFLEGLVTLIIFNADDGYNKKLNKYAEDFRKNTMRVLGVQLNNITVLDVIAYGGAVLGIILTVFYYSNATINLRDAIIIILLSSEFFLPLRLLGSFFHIAMNGMGVVDHLFRVLDMPDVKDGSGKITDEDYNVELKGINFSYNEERTILKNIDMNFGKDKITYIVGESGCGKSTIANLIINKVTPFTGEVLYNNTDNVSEEEILKNCTLVTNNPYLFKGTLRYNLQMGNKDITDDEMWYVLEKFSLKEYFEHENGLDTLIFENGSNFSGGQRQRIAIARAILKKSPIYIFDEATSNIDSESEEIIMKFLDTFRKNKLIILISHRLKYTINSDYIYYMKDGAVEEKGSYNELISINGEFKKLYDNQMALENWGIKYE
ncbi:ABC transporter ATP-binding protein/permease [Peptoniphilus sp. oral taxon 386]|uniref:ABC transporter ATP-binding protein/permease n=1 Tax=Peptoniphilus sp. oral taxon 386 TaxID=652713 RepID=UPI0001DA9A56|nr:ABC transporter ATP-binding protein/permease [Peptoniphilus sp. oral taxon 386]EFI41904.1 ABC transporter, ATP-binding protein [Peptoniphilus sp. oral taxon 386 str. F0131]